MLLKHWWKHDIKQDFSEHFVLLNIDYADATKSRIRLASYTDY